MGKGLVQFMIKIRRNVFETNSSSTHNMTMCTDNEWVAWEKGEVYLCTDDWFEFTDSIWARDFEEGIFYPKDKVMKFLDKYDAKSERKQYFKTLKEFFHESELETFSDTYITPNGEKIHAFGNYGYRG